MSPEDMKKAPTSNQYVYLTHKLLDCCHNKERFHRTLLQNLPKDIKKRRQVLIQLNTQIRISNSELLHIGITHYDLLSAILKCRDVIANILKKGLQALKNTNTNTSEYKLIESIRKYYMRTTSHFNTYATTGMRIVLAVPQVMLMLCLSVSLMILSIMSTDSKTEDESHLTKLTILNLVVDGISTRSIIKFIRNVFKLHQVQKSQKLQTTKRLSTILHGTNKLTPHSSKGKTTSKTNRTHRSPRSATKNKNR